MDSALRIQCATGVAVEGGFGNGGGGNGMALVIISFSTSGFNSLVFTSVEDGMYIIFCTKLSKFLCYGRRERGQ